MKYDRFHDAVLELPGAEYAVKWRNERVYSIQGRMFVIAGKLGDIEPLYRMKVSPYSFELLIESGDARPSPYLARAMWVELTSPDRLTDDELMTYVKRSYTLVYRPNARSKSNNLKS